MASITSTFIYAVMAILVLVCNTPFLQGCESDRGKRRLANGTAAKPKATDKYTEFKKAVVQYLINILHAPRGAVSESFLRDFDEAYALTVLVPSLRRKFLDKVAEIHSILFSKENIKRQAQIGFKDSTNSQRIFQNEDKLAFQKSFILSFATSCFFMKTAADLLDNEDYPVEGTTASEYIRRKSLANLFISMADNSLGTEYAPDMHRMWFKLAPFTTADWCEKLEIQNGFKNFLPGNRAMSTEEITKACYWTYNKAAQSASALARLYYTVNNEYVSYEKVPRPIYRLRTEAFDQHPSCEDERMQKLYKMQLVDSVIKVSEFWNQSNTSLQQLSNSAKNLLGDLNVIYNRANKACYAADDEDNLDPAAQNLACINDGTQDLSLEDVFSVEDD